MTVHFLNQSLIFQKITAFMIGFKVGLLPNRNELDDLVTFIYCTCILVAFTML